MLGVLIALGVVVLVLLYGVIVFNLLIRRRNRVDNAWADIDVQLRRRYDLIPNLVEAVRSYAAHERGVMEQVSEARGRAIGATGVADQAQAESDVTRALRQLFAVAEAYPQIRASENFAALQEELASTESRIAVARQLYNDQVMQYNTAIQQFPSLVVARATGFRPREFFETEEDSRGVVPVRP